MGKRAEQGKKIYPKHKVIPSIYLTRNNGVKSVIFFELSLNNKLNHIQIEKNKRFLFLSKLLY